LPDGWLPSPALAAFADGLGFSGHLLDEAVAEFRDYWRAVPGARGVKLDWDATFRNRLRETAGRQKGRGNGSGKRSLVDAARELADRLGREKRERMRSADGGDPGREIVQLLPGFGRK
jgi:hypothetical protein